MKIGAKALVCILLLMPASVLMAQDVVVEKLNARILPTVWFSALEASEGEKIRIYAGIQNNSGSDFSGTVTFYADDVEVGRTSFTSASDSLKEVSVEWLALGGKHNFFAKIEPQLPEDKILLSYESNKSVLNVSKVFTVEEVKEGAKEFLAVASDKIDVAAEALAVKLESLKITPQLAESSQQQSSESSEGIEEVAGASTGPEEASGTSGLLAQVVNGGIDTAQFLLDKWEWSLPVAIIGILLLSFVL